MDPLENESELLEVGTNICSPPPTLCGADSDKEIIPKGRSVAHFLFYNKRAHYISFDIETGGEYVGIVQISAQVIHLTLTAKGSTITKDTAECEVEDDIFDSYVNPKVSPALWDDCSIAIHGICLHDERITGAKDIHLIWYRFRQWIFKHVPPGEYATLIAWNGAACDLKWIWKLTQAPNSQQVMPPQLRYFIDPYRVIEAYSSCAINKKTSKLETYQLGTVWKYLHPDHYNFNNGHNSQDDVVAQTYVFTHVAFIPFINRSKSVKTIDEIFTRSKQNAFRKKMEPSREVHLPWKEVTMDLFAKSAGVMGMINMFNFT
jgi:hypothetical protein